MASKYARKKYYKVVNRDTGRVISRHHKLSTARKVVVSPKHRDNRSIRVVDQDDRAMY